MDERASQGRVIQLEVLCEEIWGVFTQTILESRFTDEETKAKAFSALQHVDGKLRAAGLKRFPAKFVKQGQQSGGG